MSPLIGPALVAAGRGAAIVPRMTLGQAPVTVCAVPPLGGRHIAALHATRPTPATLTVLDVLAETTQYEMTQ
jgi:DNA-binding transcriptional LysR family regulator